MAVVSVVKLSVSVEMLKWNTYSKYMLLIGNNKNGDDNNTTTVIPFQALGPRYHYDVIVRKREREE